MSSIFAFSVRALDCNIRVETACRDAYDMLVRYIFPPLPKSDSPLDPPQILVCVKKLQERFQISVDGAEVATACDVMDAVLASIKALDDVVIKHLSNLYAKFGVLDTTQHRRSRLANEALRRAAVTLNQLRGTEQS